MSDFVARIERQLAGPEPTRTQVVLRRITIALLLVALPLVLAEVGLRLYGYSRPQIPWHVQSATNAASAAMLNERFDTDAFTPDRYLLWRHKPGANVAGLDVRPAGTLGPFPYTRVVKSPAKPAAKVLCLGDSVTAVTAYTWPGITQRLLSTGLGTERFEFINASVAGYSTEQGLRWLAKLREQVQPQVVVICFGWNDHFPALNLPDKELGARNAAAAVAHRMLYRSRLYQLLSAPRRHNGVPDPTTTESLRVAPGEFHRNLVQLVRLARESGAIPMLATQPDLLTSDTVRYYQSERFGAPTGLVEYHRRYNAIVRDVAAETNAPLVDLEEEFDRRNKPWLFEPDGMHLNGPGHNLVARLLIGQFRNEKLITQEEFDRVVSAARYDSSAPDKPRAAWVLTPPHVDATTTDTGRVAVLAKNTGNSTWLGDNVLPRMGSRKNVKHGGVSVVGKWRTVGAPTTAPAARKRLAYDLLPGESTSTSLEFAIPPVPGIYEMEIGLDAEGIGELRAHGAEVTTLTVSARGG